jgi:hypothetical protein
LKINVARTLVAVAAVAGAGAICAPSATADDTAVHTLGSPAELVNGTVVQAWTIRDLKPSSDAIPYPVAGTLWEATATDTAIQGSVAPIVSNLNARARSGQTYRVLFGVATAQGVNPATLAQGQTTSGTVYFDVTGDTPDSVVYNAGGPDLAVWVQPPPAPPRTGSYPSTHASPAGTAAPAEAAALPPGAAPAAAVAGAPLAPGTEGTPPPPVSQGTPIPPVSQGTPLPAGSQGTALPATTAAIPAPTAQAPTPGVQDTPPAVGSAGTTLPAGNTGAPLPAGSQGTPSPAAAAPTTTVVPAP